MFFLNNLILKNFCIKIASNSIYISRYLYLCTYSIYLQILPLFLVISTAITVEKHEKNNNKLLKKHDKRGLANLEYNLPEPAYHPPEPAIFEPSAPDLGHLESVVAPVAPPPAVLHPAR